MRKTYLKKELESLYSKYNRSDYIKSDPIKFVYNFKDQKEREVVALISSSLSFGRVLQIFKAIEYVLSITGNSPIKFIENLGEKPENRIKSFRYRFVDGDDLFCFLKGIQKIIRENGSIGALVKDSFTGDVYDLLKIFSAKFHDSGYLVPKGIDFSPCKRLFMLLRWMVRKDNIDLGLWDFIDPSHLIIPLDTHIFQASRSMGLTSRKSASKSAALEITMNLKKFCSKDPVKYDWALSRTGIIKNNF